MSQYDSDDLRFHLVTNPKGYNAVVEENVAMLTPDEEAKALETSRADVGSFAYELLLLQQRLAAYEQLHREEMAELHQEIERLRRSFLQETNPMMRAVSPLPKNQVPE